MLTVEQIKNVVVAYFQDKPVKQVWLFGSYARGEADEKSDIDLLVEVDYAKRVGWEFYSWKDELKDALGNSKVDVVSLGGLSKYIGPNILNETRLIYAK
ncbi:MAG: nucleotidyltransferase domain-containing protein [Chitinophagaceae bacterium]